MDSSVFISCLNFPLDPYLAELILFFPPLFFKKSPASGNDGTISYGNETTVSQRGKEWCEKSTKGAAVIECHSHGPTLLATVLTRSLITSRDISLCWVAAMLPGLLMSLCLTGCTDIQVPSSDRQLQSSVCWSQVDLIDFLGKMDHWT